MARNLVVAYNGQEKPILFRRFRGPIAKEIYRFGKALVLCHNGIGAGIYCVAQIPRELTRGYIQSCVGEFSLVLVGYCTGLTSLTCFYKLLSDSKVKTVARGMLNTYGLVATLPAWGVGKTCDVIALSKLEKIWFGTPIYLFDDNRIWLEQNCTLGEFRDNLLK